MNDTTKILTIQDISCYGQCSITVALPVISAFGIETAILPSAVLSTHTSGPSKSTGKRKESISMRYTPDS